MQHIYPHMEREKERNFIMNTHMPTTQPKNKASQPQLRSGLGRSRAWHPTPIFLPGESCGQRSLEGYSP